MAYLPDIKKNILANKSFDFSIRIVDLYRFLIKKNEYVLSKQILRSGTAIGALITEAQNAESKKDFIHKLGISQKECSETIYWLNVLLKGKYINTKQFQSISNDTEELLKMLRSSIMTAKKSL